MMPLEEKRAAAEIVAALSERLERSRVSRDATNEVEAHFVLGCEAELEQAISYIRTRWGLQ